MKSSTLIRRKCREIERMLLEKNKAYGDSMLRPVPVFGDGDPEAAIRARIDDKLNRIRNAPGAFGENDVLDLVGYLVGLLIVLDGKQCSSHSTPKQQVSTRFRQLSFRFPPATSK